MTTPSRFRFLVPVTLWCLIAGTAVVSPDFAHAASAGSDAADESAASGGSVSPSVWRPGAAGQTYPVPARVVHGPTSLPAAGAVRLVKVTGVAGVPTRPRAVSVRVDVTPKTNGGALFVHTPGAVSPAAVGWLHARDPRTFPTVVTPDANGRIAVRVTSKALVTVRVDGYVTNPGQAGPGGVTTVKPIKVLDTAAGIGGGPLAPATVRTVVVGGRGGIPATGVRAAWVSFGVQAPAASGNLKVWAPGDPVPAVEQLGFTAGRNAGNLLLVPVDTRGRFNVSVSRAVSSLRAAVVAWIAAPPPEFDTVFDRGLEPVSPYAPVWRTVSSGDPALAAAEITLTGGATTVPRRARQVLVYLQVNAGSKAVRVTVEPAVQWTHQPKDISVTVPAHGMLSLAVPVSTDYVGAVTLRYSRTLPPPRPRLRIGGYIAFNPIAAAPVAWVGSTMQPGVTADPEPAAMSEDGRYVAFSSDDPDLVEGDTNGRIDVFVRDLATGALTRVSVSTGGAQADGASFSPTMSGDGRYVAFVSGSDLLDGGARPSDHRSSVYLHDRAAATTVRLPEPADEDDRNSSSWPKISADGRFVALVSSSRLLPEDDNGREDVYVYDRSTGEYELVTVAPDGTAGEHGGYAPTISGDGRFVSFVAQDSDLVPGETNYALDVLLRDRVAGTTEVVSLADDGSPASGVPGDFLSYSGGVSDDGRYVAFHSTAYNLVPGDRQLRDDEDVFLRDREEGRTIRASAPLPGVDVSHGQSTGALSSLSADGRFVAYESLRADLVEGDEDGGLTDVFVYDREDGTNTLVSMPGSGDPTPTGGIHPVITRDGSRVAFISDGPTFLPGDTPFSWDLFVAQRR